MWQEVWMSQDVNITFCHCICGLCIICGVGLTFIIVLGFCDSTLYDLHLVAGLDGSGRRTIAQRMVDNSAIIRKKVVYETKSYIINKYTTETVESVNPNDHLIIVHQYINYLQRSIEFKSIYIPQQIIDLIKTFYSKPAVTVLEIRSPENYRNLSERKDLLECTPDMNLTVLNETPRCYSLICLFVCDISKFDEYTDANQSTNSLVASLNYFVSLQEYIKANIRFFGMDTIVLLNNSEVFRGKIETQRVSLNVCPEFKDFTRSNNYISALDSIKRKFVSKARETGDKRFDQNYIHVVENHQTVLQKIRLTQNHILRTSLREIGLL